MKRTTLLAASVAIALTGCGGSNGDSNNAPETKTITAMDGYYQNAIVFVDSDNDGQWTEGETILGATNKEGQLTVEKSKISEKGSLAIRTITNTDSALYKAMVAEDASFAGKVTIDSDRSGQSVSKEITLRAPHSSNVITPITDAVSIVMDKIKKDNLESSNVEKEAKDAVTKNLGLENGQDLYVDVVTNHKLHKTAQILTTAKEVNGNCQDGIDTLLEQATKEVQDMKDEDLKDNSYVPVINIKDGAIQDVITNHKLTVNTTALKTINDKISSQKLIESNLFSDSINIASLFDDADNNNIEPSITKENLEQLQTLGLKGTLTDSTLNLDANTLKAGVVTLVITANDLAEDTSKQGSVSVSLKITVSGKNPLEDKVWYMMTHENHKLTCSIMSFSNGSFKFSNLSKNATSQCPNQGALETTRFVSDYSVDGNTIISHQDDNDMKFEYLPAQSPDKSGSITVKFTDGNKTSNTTFYSSESVANSVLTKANTKPTTEKKPQANTKTSPLENQIWYSVSWDNLDNGQTSEVSKVCRAIKFSNNKMLTSDWNEEFTSKCPTESDINTNNTSKYEVTDAGLRVKNPEGDSDDDVLYVIKSQDENSISGSANTKYDHDYFEYFKDIKYAETMLNSDSYKSTPDNY